VKNLVFFRLSAESRVQNNQRLRRQFFKMFFIDYSLVVFVYLEQPLFAIYGTAPNNVRFSGWCCASRATYSVFRVNSVASAVKIPSDDNNSLCFLAKRGTGTSLAAVSSFVFCRSTA
jgi:hypothetical protein